MNKYFKNIVTGKIVIAMCSLVLIGTSCKKETALTNTTTTSTTTTPFGSIVATNFGWSNVNKLTLNFVGQSDRDYNSILKVTTSDNSVLFQKLQNGSANFSTSFNVPSTYHSITVSFGGIQKTFITKNGTVTMNLN